MKTRQVNTGAIVSKNSKHDEFILRHYKQPGWPVAKIAAHLGIPRGSVITRYQIANGRKRVWEDGHNKLTPLERPPASLPKLKFLGEK